MEDLENDKDLEEEEFKTNAKPSTSRAMTTRSCNKNVNYQCDESDKEEDSDDFDESTNNSEDENSGDNYDGYSSPDIDYEAVANYEENSVLNTVSEEIPRYVIESNYIKNW